MIWLSKRFTFKLGVMCYSAERKSIPVVINFSIDVEAYRSPLFMASFKALPKKSDTSPSPFSPFTLPVPLRNVPAQAKIRKIATKIRVRAGVEYFYGKRVMHLGKLRSTDYSRNRPVWTAV